MQIEYSKTAVKFINKMDRPTKQRIKAAIEGLTEQPPKGGYKNITRLHRRTEKAEGRKVQDNI